MATKQDWFTHDQNARKDPKCIALIANEGMAAYGRYWALVEILRGEEEYKYRIGEKFAYPALATELHMETDDAVEFIKSCIEDYELFDTDGEFLWSNSLLDRMKPLDQKRERYRQNGKRGADERWGKDKEDKKEATKTRKKRAPKKVDDFEGYSEEEVNKFKAFEEWQKVNSPAVLKMDEPFTIKQYLSIFKDYPKQDILKILVQMHNHKPLKTKKSANLTARNWLNNNKERGGNNTSPNNADSALEQILSKNNG